MRKYELTYLVSDTVPESDLNKVTGKVAGFINGLQGKIIKEDIWGRRKLAYPIKKQEFATYVTLNFELPAEKAIEFEKDLRHIDGIIRELLIVKDRETKELKLTSKDIADSKEITEVIGGEKSFEAVEGETEESRSLMAKREEESQDDSLEAPSESVEKFEEVEEKTEEKIKPKEKIEEPKEETKTKKTPTKIKKKPVEKAETAKTKKAATPKESKKVSDEVERLSKLNEELDDILKDEL